MLNIKELTPGDWVRDNGRGDWNDRDCFQVGSIELVKGEDSGRVFWRVNDNYKWPGNWVITTERTIEAIPLTKEVLELNGFTSTTDAVGNVSMRKSDIDSSTKRAYTISCKLAQDGTNIVRVQSGEYCDVLMHNLALHDLQHVIRLVGLVDIANSVKVYKND